jgi:hypothetical protein
MVDTSDVCTSISSSTTSSSTALRDGNAMASMLCKSPAVFFCALQLVVEI